ncbi:MAG: hypothetical protein AAF845_05375 [Bacteroidota bacterium]
MEPDAPDTPTPTTDAVTPRPAPTVPTVDSVTDSAPATPPSSSGLSAIGSVVQTQTTTDDGTTTTLNATGGVQGDWVSQDGDTSASVYLGGTVSAQDSPTGSNRTTDVTFGANVQSSDSTPTADTNLWADFYGNYTTTSTSTADGQTTSTQTTTVGAEVGASVTFKQPETPEAVAAAEQRLETAQADLAREAGDVYVDRAGALAQIDLRDNGLADGLNEDGLSLGRMIGTLQDNAETFGRLTPAGYADTERAELIGAVVERSEARVDQVAAENPEAFRQALATVQATYAEFRNSYGDGAGEAWAAFQDTADRVGYGVAATRLPEGASDTLRSITASYSYFEQQMPEGVLNAAEDRQTAQIYREANPTPDAGQTSGQTPEQTPSQAPEQTPAQETPAQETPATEPVGLER